MVLYCMSEIKQYLLSEPKPPRVTAAVLMIAELKINYKIYW